MSDNRKSKTVTQGVQRSPNRALLRAVGFGDGDFDKPIVGVANAHSTVTPCNMGIGALAARAEAALKKAGAMPQMFGKVFPGDWRLLILRSSRLKSSAVTVRVPICCSRFWAVRRSFLARFSAAS